MRRAGSHCLLRLPNLTVKVRAGRAVRKHKLVKSGWPDDLVFQSVQTGRPMNDQNILKRHIQPAARKLGLPFVNWRCLRTSHATWLVQAGADPKSVQGQMRHSRISTTMDIYAQIVPTSQRRALQQLSAFASGGTTPAALQTAAMDLDFPSAKKMKTTRPKIYVPIHVPKRSKSTEFSMIKYGEKSRQVIEKIGGASRARTDDLIVANDALSQLSYSPTPATKSSADR